MNHLIKNMVAVGLHLCYCRPISLHRYLRRNWNCNCPGFLDYSNKKVYFKIDTEKKL